jgi:hypothetical protein
VDGPTRSVTDINWALDPDLVVSIGIDSWLWAWDLREPRKPIFGFSAFNGKYPFAIAAELTPEFSRSRWHTSEME